MDRWQHALIWVEFRQRADQPMRPYQMHALYRNETGGVAYEARPASDMAYTAPTRARTTPRQFEDYLRGVLVAHGGDRDAYTFLGVPRPAPVAPVVTDDVQEALDELYARVAKVMGVGVEDLVARYGHLNPGLQSMNLRNRLRERGANV